MEAIAVTGALYLARAARDAIGPRLRAAAQRYFQKQQEEEFLSRGFDWAEDVFPAVALGCASLAANNRVPITTLSIAFGWILGCRYHRWWLHQADTMDDESIPEDSPRRSRSWWSWGSSLPSKQSFIIYAHSTFKPAKVLEITAHLNRRADYLSVEEELLDQQLDSKVQQQIDNKVRQQQNGDAVGAFIASWLSKRVGEDINTQPLYSNPLSDKRAVEADATQGLDKKAKTTVENIHQEMWKGPMLTTEEKRKGFNYAAWVIVQLKNRKEGRLFVFLHRIKGVEHKEEVVALRLPAPFMARLVEPSKWRPYTLQHWLLLAAASGAVVGVLAHHHTALSVPPPTPEPTPEGIKAVWMAAVALLGGTARGGDGWAPS